MARHGRNAGTPDLMEGFDGARADYDAVRQSRFRRRRLGVDSTGHSADYHLRSPGQHMKMIELARDFDRNEPMVGQAVTRAVDNTLQHGPALDPETGSKKLDQELKARWDAWSGDADRCDLAGEMDLHQMARLSLRSMIVDGDVFALPRQDGEIEMVEAHRCRNPVRTDVKLMMGVEVDPLTRRRLRYYFTKEETVAYSARLPVDSFTPFDARDSQGRRQVLHIYNPHRFSQTRGVTGFAPVFDLKGMLGDAVFAVLVKLLVSASFVTFRKRNASFTGQGQPAPVGEQTTETMVDNTTRAIEGLGPGTEIRGEIGEELEGFSPNVTSAESLEFIEMIDRKSVV